ncbi:MAG: inositol monophosphatase [Chloroflexi bacterium]|nr:inositol monophosphatase [Chloroflexota bacterium]
MSTQYPPASPPPDELAAVEAHAASLAQQAGDLLLEHFNRPLEVSYKSKGHADPVTEADRASEKLLMDGIRARFPSHAILSEETPETSNAGSPYLWVLDPLDGTTNFLNRFPLWAVSIGVLYQGIPVAGALFVPVLTPLGGQVLHAGAGGGAFLGSSPIKLPSDDEPSDRRLAAVPGFFWNQFRVHPDLRRKIGELRSTGTIVGELALASAGALQFAAFSGPKIWDVAAGILVVQEAGGRVLVRAGRGAWQPFHSFTQPGAGLPRDGDLRKWSAGLLAGGPQSVAEAAQGLRPRRGLRRWLRRLLGIRRR